MSTERKIRIQPILGAMIGVWYPHRKTPDLYVVLEGRPVFCAQCEATFPAEQWPEHILSHDSRRRGKAGVSA